MLAAALLSFAPAPAHAQADSGPQLIVFMDCSGSMLAGGSSADKFTETVGWLMNEVDVRLQSGVSVRVIPFDSGPIKGDGRFYAADPAYVNAANVPAAATALAAVTMDIRNYLEGAKPSTNKQRKAIWHTIAGRMKLLAEAGPNTRVLVCTDGEDSAWSLAEKDKVLAEIRSNWKLPAAAPDPVVVWTWHPAPYPPHVAVVFDKYDLGILRPQDFATGAWKGTITARAIVVAPGTSGSAGAALEPTVTWAPVSDGAPPLKVGVSLPPSTPLTGSGSANLALTLSSNSFPAGAFTADYQLRVAFTYRSNVNVQGLADIERSQTVSVPRPVKVSVSSKPALRLAVDPETPLSLLAGQVGRVKVTLSGNADAAGRTYQLRASLPKGVDAELAPWAPDDAQAALATTRPAGKMESDRIVRDVELPANGKPVDLVCRVHASEALNDTIQFSVPLAGQEKTAKIDLTVTKPVISSALRRPQFRTRLKTGKEWQDKGFQPLGCGPLQLTAQGVPATTLVTVSVANEAGSDVMVGLGTKCESSVTMPLGDMMKEAGSYAPGLYLYAYWKSPVPSPAPSMPKLRIEVKDPNAEFIQLSPREISLDGMLDLQRPEFWAEAEGESGERQVLHAGNVAERVVAVRWTPEAVGSILTASPESVPAGGRIVSIRPVEGDAELVEEAPNQFRLAGKVQFEGRLKIVVEAPASLKGKVSDSYKITLHMAGSAVASGAAPGTGDTPPVAAAPGMDRSVDLSYDLMPNVVTVEVAPDAIGRPTELFAGTALSAATLRVRGDGLKGAVVVEPVLTVDGVDPAACPVASLAQGGQAVDRLALLSAGDAVARVRFKPTASAKLGKQFKSKLVVRAISDDPKVPFQVRLGKDGEALDSVEVPLEFAVTPWTVLATYDGRPCTVLPPVDAFVVDRKGAEMRTGDWIRKFRFEISPKVDLPEEVRAKKLHFTARGGGLLPPLFEIDGERKPEVTVGDVERAGLILRANPAKAAETYDPTSATGEIALESDDGSIQLRLPVNISIPPVRGPGKVFFYALCAVVGAVLVIVMAVTVRGVLARRKKKGRKGQLPHWPVSPDVAGPDDDSPVSLDEVLSRGGASSNPLEPPAPSRTAAPSAGAGTGNGAQRDSLTEVLGHSGPGAPGENGESSELDDLLRG